MLWSNDQSSRGFGTLRRGFTVIELLVAVGVIALLLAIILPAVQEARNTARRTQCASNLRQLGLSIHSYHDSFNFFPPGNINGLSMFTRILPHIDQAALYEKVDFSTYESPTLDLVRRTQLQILLCPGDSGLFVYGSTNYAGNSGTGLHAKGLFEGFFGPVGELDGRALNSASIRDGLSSTAAFSEQLLGHIGSLEECRSYPLRTVWSVPQYYSEPNELQQFLTACDQLDRNATISETQRGREWTFGNLPYTFYNHTQTPNHKACAYNSSVLLGSYTAISLHHGGVNVCLGDGSVRFVSNSIDGGIWRAIGTRSGDEPVSEF